MIICPLLFEQSCSNLVPSARYHFKKTNLKELSMRKPLAPINKDLVPETITFEQAAEMAEICNSCLMDAAIKGMIEVKKLENGSFVINTISLLNYINENR